MEPPKLAWAGNRRAGRTALAQATFLWASAVSSERREQEGPRTMEDPETTALSRRQKVCVPGLTHSLSPWGSSPPPASQHVLLAAACGAAPTSLFT